MPNPNAKNLESTFDKNRDDLMDSIWYGAKYQKLVDDNDNVDEFDKYDAEQKDSMGFSKTITRDTTRKIQSQTIRDHIKDRTFSSYRKFYKEIERAKYREIAENEALYNQIYESLPENEPMREEKARFLLEGLHNPSTQAYLDELYMKSSDPLLRGIDDLFEGENAKNTTIGDVLDRLAFSKAEKEAFVRKYGFGSVDQTLYQHRLNQNADDRDLPLKNIMSNAQSDLLNCLTDEAHDLATQELQEEMSPDEKQYIDESRRKFSRFKKEDPEYYTRIEPWIQEKGQSLYNDLRMTHIAGEMVKNRLLLEGGKSLNGISANAPYKTCLKDQVEERTYISEIINGEKTGEELVGAAIKYGRDHFLTLKRKSAEEHIDLIKVSDRYRLAYEDAHPARQFAELFAARSLANSVRGNKKTLGKDFTVAELNEKAEEILENDHFNDFIRKTYFDDENRENAKLRETEQKLSSARTHGGFIEDEFKKYLLKRPAGELDNSPEIARFMPTAKERIEELKRQVKNDPENKELQAKAAAEIIAIRNACQVERKSGYGLDKQIPPAPNKKTLSHDVSNMINDEECNKLLQDDATRKDLLTGHGGKMMVNVRKKYEEQVNAAQKKQQTESLLKKNTVSGRMAELCAEAQELSSQLASRNTKLRSEALEKSKSILGEYTALVGLAAQPQGKDADAPWKVVNSVADSATKDKSAAEMLKTPEKASAMMNVIASGDVIAFHNKFTQEMNAQKTSKAPTVPAIQQPGRIQEVQQPGVPH